MELVTPLEETSFIELVSMKKDPRPIFNKLTHKMLEAH